MTSSRYTHKKSMDSMGGSSDCGIIFEENKEYEDSRSRKKEKD